MKIGKNSVETPLSYTVYMKNFIYQRSQGVVLG